MHTRFILDTTKTASGARNDTIKELADTLGFNLNIVEDESTYILYKGKNATTGIKVILGDTNKMLGIVNGTEDTSNTISFNASNNNNVVYIRNNDTCIFGFINSLENMPNAWFGVDSCTYADTGTKGYIYCGLKGDANKCWTDKDSQAATNSFGIYQWGSYNLIGGINLFDHEQYAYAEHIVISVIGPTNISNAVIECEISEEIYTLVCANSASQVKLLLKNPDS